jgi:hypothetical protein
VAVVLIAPTVHSGSEVVQVERVRRRDARAVNEASTKTSLRTALQRWGAVSAESDRRRWPAASGGECRWLRLRVRLAVRMAIPLSPELSAAWSVRAIHAGHRGSAVGSEQGWPGSLLYLAAVLRLSVPPARRLQQGRRCAIRPDTATGGPLSEHLLNELKEFLDQVRCRTARGAADQARSNEPNPITPGAPGSGRPRLLRVGAVPVDGLREVVGTASRGRARNRRARRTESRSAKWPGRTL